MNWDFESIPTFANLIGELAEKQADKWTISHFMDTTALWYHKHINITFFVIVHRIVLFAAVAQSHHSFIEHFDYYYYCAYMYLAWRHVIGLMRSKERKNHGQMARKQKGYKWNREKSVIQIVNTNDACFSIFLVLLFRSTSSIIIINAMVFAHIYFFSVFVLFLLYFFQFSAHLRNKIYGIWQSM